MTTLVYPDIIKFDFAKVIILGIRNGGCKLEKRIKIFSREKNFAFPRSVSGLFVLLLFLKITMGKEGKYCYRYPHAALTTDCVVFSFDGRALKVLLIRRAAEPCKDRWAFPGGFLEMDETLEEGARRELMEETSFSPEVLEQFHAFSTVDRDPRERVVTVAFFALVKPGKVNGGDDAAEARWFDVHELPVLAFDHDEILSVALNRLSERIFLVSKGIGSLGETFPLPQLLQIREIISGGLRI